MLLALDVGNTHTVLGLFEGPTLVRHWRIRTVKGGTADEYGVLLRDLLRDALLANRTLSGVIIASVVPPLDAVLREMVRSFFDLEPLFVTAENLPGIPVLYHEPKDVGADRVVNALAALAEHSPPLIVVDFGTALTFDVINEKGEYEGGSIAPGIGISLSALYREASRLAPVDLVPPPTPIGRSTEESIQAGVLFGYASLVEGMVERIGRELEGAPTVIATGGHAPLMAGLIEGVTVVDPDLTLKGLRLAYEALRKNS
jgi:type III pantothenate kinase